MDTLNHFLEICYDHSPTLRVCRSWEAMTLDAFLELQAEKVAGNQRITPLLDPEDFYTQAEAVAAARLQPDIAAQAVRGIRTGVLCTADHHGGIFCAQTFQTDLLFGDLLRRLGYRETALPIAPGAQVELDSSTYARGILNYASPDHLVRMPIFPDRPALQACCAPPINAAWLRRFRGRFLTRKWLNKVDRAVNAFITEVYESEPVLASRRFDDQVTRIGAGLSRELFGETGPILTYLDLESMILPLLIRELSEGNTLLAALLWDERLRAGVVRTPLPGGGHLADFFFRGVDEKGRKFRLTLNEDNLLTGTDWKGVSYAIPADAESICPLLAQRRLMPGILTMALATFFERGISWLGGVFQTIYLPEYQQGLVSVLKQRGMDREAAVIGGYDCTGYICGPMYALYQGSGYTTSAGPVELRISRPSYGQLMEIMRRTRLGDAHRMGLHIMYSDLVGKGAREENWYRRIAEALNDRYPENVIAYGP